jgi:alkanesulfonate monooxygenase SsuD/methylene tetrahydromethanopterin reductase-like flavin-dependent oxidoreductase (luciferase family)
VDPDRHRACAAVKSHVAVALLNPQWPISAAARQAQERVRAAYDYRDHMSASATARFAALVPDEVVPEFAIAGTPADCLAQVRALFAAGVDEITIRPYAVEGQSRGAMLEAFARDVLTPLRQG